MNSPAPLNRTSVDRDATRPQETPETQDRTRNATTTANRKEAGQFTLPDLGEGLTEAEIVRWHVAVGDRVAADQVVVEVETAKAVVDVPCPLAGVVEALHGEPGDVIAVGAPLTTISGDSSPHEQHRTEERAGSGNVLVGYGTGTAARRRRQRVRPQHAVARPATGAPRVLSPIVRRLAKQHGVDLSSVDGSGPGGVILRRDVEAARLPEPERDEVR
ncbi:biotin/lipoyl-containing protein, partial [Saccharopolyspora kobensis]